MKISTLNINLSKIDKSKLYKGEKGTYLGITILWNDEPDKYGNSAMVVQDVGKEAREAGEKGAILGNVKHIQQKESQSEPEPEPDDDGSDLPF